MLFLRVTKCNGLCEITIYTSMMIHVVEELKLRVTLLDDLN